MYLVPASAQNGSAGGPGSTGHLTCGAALANEQALQQHPGQAKEMQQLEDFTKRFVSEKKIQQTGKLIIPVVVHVIHNYGSEYINQSQVYDALRILNEDFNRRNPDTNVVSPLFRGIEGKEDFEFRLATIDPNGMCTNGITYTVSSLTNSAGDNVKALISWNTTKYFNIWVAQSVLAGTQAVGGYAYFPGSLPTGAYNDGVIVTCHQFGSIGASSPNNFSSRTLTHETGHYFNLRHTFGNTNGPGPIANCTAGGGDLVDDTPPTVGVANQTCPLTMADCGSIANVENYMDYSNCGRMFTLGQQARMQAAAASSTSARNHLWSAANLTVTGVADGSAGTICAPHAVILSDYPQSCSSLVPVSFKASVDNTIIDTTLRYAWTFPGGNPATSSDAEPSIYYPLAGTYNVQLVVSNQFGADTVTNTAFVQARGGQAGLRAPFVENFESPLFLTATDSTFKDWTNVEGNWESSTDAAHSLGRSALIDNSLFTAGTVSNIISPVISLSGLPDSTAPVYVSFYTAFAARNNTDTDKLTVYASTNCGQSWSLVLRLPKSSLLSHSGLVAGTFIPTASEWKKDSIRMLIPASAGQLKLKFEMTSGGGNRLYLDDLRINTVGHFIQGLSLQSTASTLHIFPNPTNSDADLQFRGQAGRSFRSTLSDVLGQQLGEISGTFGTEGAYNTRLSTALASPLKPGVYLLRTTDGLSLTTSKLVINK